MEMTTRQLKDKYVTQNLVRFTQDLMANKTSQTLLMRELAAALIDSYDGLFGVFK